jgi:hypothetical protein
MAPWHRSDAIQHRDELGTIIKSVPVSIKSGVPRGDPSPRLLLFTWIVYFPVQIYLNGLLLCLLPCFLARQPRKLRGE